LIWDTDVDCAAHGAVEFIEQGATEPTGNPRSGQERQIFEGMSTQRLQDFAVWAGCAESGYGQCVELGLALGRGVSPSVLMGVRMGHVRMGRTREQTRSGRVWRGGELDRGNACDRAFSA
jgi:hypothetical protein